MLDEGKRKSKGEIREEKKKRWMRTGKAHR